MTGLLAQKISIPDVAIFLVTGIAIGPQALRLIDIGADSPLNQIVLLFGASYILFDGGASLRFSVLKRVWISIVVLATIGVLITAGITGLAAHYIVGVPVIVALLLGATLSSTDPATLVPIFRQVRIRDRVAQTVMSEFRLQRRHGCDPDLQHRCRSRWEPARSRCSRHCSTCSGNPSSVSSPALCSDIWPRF